LGPTAQALPSLLVCPVERVTAATQRASGTGMTTSVDGTTAMGLTSWHAPTTLSVSLVRQDLFYK